MTTQTQFKSTGRFSMEVFATIIQLHSIEQCFCTSGMCIFENGDNCWVCRCTRNNENDYAIWFQSANIVGMHSPPYFIPSFLHFASNNLPLFTSHVCGRGLYLCVSLPNMVLRLIGPDSGPVESRLPPVWKRTTVILSLEKNGQPVRHTPQNPGFRSDAPCLCKAGEKNSG